MLSARNLPAPRARRADAAPGSPGAGDASRDAVRGPDLRDRRWCIGPAWLGGTAEAEPRGKPRCRRTSMRCSSPRSATSPTAIGQLPVICFDLAGGANLVGSEVLVGVQGGQTQLPLDRRLRQARRAGQHGADLERQHRRVARPAVARRRRHQARHPRARRPRPRPPRAPTARCSARCRRTTRRTIPTTRCTASPWRAPRACC